MNIRNQVKANYTSAAVGPGDFTDRVWERAEAVRVDHYWSGEPADAGREFTASFAWSDDALLARFDCVCTEPPVIADDPRTQAKTIGLWERDVCEIFIAPDANEPRRYLEFEAAPTGEWLDVAIDLTSGERLTDWDYRSGMRTAAKTGPGRVLIAMTIPWAAFGKRPEPGDIWLGNIFRCVGRDPGRGYLAWQPTMTAVPNFHVPGAFGEFHFVRE